MGLQDEFWEARDCVRDKLSYDDVGAVSVFETTIRSLGGLLSAYDLSGDPVFLEKAAHEIKSGARKYSSIWWARLFIRLADGYYSSCPCFDFVPSLETLLFVERRFCTIFQAFPFTSVYLSVLLCSSFRLSSPCSYRECAQIVFLPIQSKWCVLEVFSITQRWQDILMNTLNKRSLVIIKFNLIRLTCIMVHLIT